MEAETEGRKRREEGGGGRVGEGGAERLSQEKGEVLVKRKRGRRAQRKEVPCGCAAEEATELWSETESPVSESFLPEPTESE